MTIVALVVMAACGLTAFLWSFDPNSYKNALQVLVQQRLDRELTIQGDLKVVFFPDIAIQAKQVSLSERASPDVFASVEDLRATIAILPLLNNHLVIEEISLGGLKAQVQRTQLDHFVFDDLLGWGKTSEASSQANDIGLLMNDISVDIAEILIKKSEFTLLDDSRKATWTLQDASLELGRIKKGEPFKAAINARIQHAGSQAQAKISASADLNVDLVSRQCIAKNFNASLKGDLPEKLWLEAVLKKVDLTLSSAMIRIDPAVGRFQVERFALRAKGLRDGDVFDFSADAPLFDISNTSAQAEGLISRLRIDGTPAIDARIALEGLQGSRNNLLFERSSLDLAIKRESRVLKVALSSPVELQPFASAMTMRALQGEVQTLEAPVAKTLFTMPVSGRLSVVMHPGEDDPFHVIGQADNLPLATLLNMMGIQSILDGNAAIDFRVGLAPGPMQPFKQSLTGTVKLRLNHASLAGFDLGDGLDALQSIVATDKSSAGFVLDRSKQTSFETAEFDLQLDRNILNLQRVKMLAPGWTLQQASPGKINLQNDTIDIALLLHLFGSQSLTTKHVTIQVRSLMVPLYVRGPVSQPEVSIQWAALDHDSIGRALKDKLTIPSVELRDLASPPNQRTPTK